MYHTSSFHVNNSEYAWYRNTLFRWTSSILHFSVVFSPQNAFFGSPAPNHNLESMRPIITPRKYWPIKYKVENMFYSLLHPLIGWWSTRNLTYIVNATLTWPVWDRNVWTNHLKLRLMTCSCTKNCVWCCKEAIFAYNILISLTPVNASQPAN